MAEAGPVTIPDWVEQALCAQDRDTLDVRWALESASALVGRGKYAEAESWVTQAAAAALASGATLRAEVLGRAAKLLAKTPSALASEANATPSMQATLQSWGPQVSKDDDLSHTARVNPPASAPQSEVTFVQAVPSVMSPGSAPAGEAAPDTTHTEMQTALPPPLPLFPLHARHAVVVEQDGDRRVLQLLAPGKPVPPGTKVVLLVEVEPASSTARES